MAITYPLSLPAAPGFRSLSLRRNSVVGETMSPYTNEDYILEYEGRLWLADVVLPPMARAQAGPWRAFFAKLNGRAGTFLMGDPSFAVPRGAAASAPGTPLVKGAGQTGQELDIDGCGNNVTGYLLEGDFIQLGTGLTSRLYQVLADVNTDGSGNATLLLWPAVRTAPADNAPLAVSSCKGLFRLTQNMTGDEVDTALFYTMQFSARSVV